MAAWSRLFCYGDALHSCRVDVYMCACFLKEGEGYILPVNHLMECYGNIREIKGNELKIDRLEFFGYTFAPTFSVSLRDGFSQLV